MSLPTLFYSPAVWVVSVAKNGHINQCRALCAAQGWQVDKVITVTCASRVDGRWTKFQKNQLRRKETEHAKAELTSNAPLIVVASGYAAEAVVAHYKNILGPQLFCVFIGSPKSTDRIFDVTIASHHEVTGDYPVYQSAAQTYWIAGVLTQAPQISRDVSRPAPHAVLIGGVNKGYDLPSGFLVAQIKSGVIGNDNTEQQVAVAFSRRTPIQLEAEIRAGLREHTVQFIDREDRKNFLDILQQADHFYVTPDSISMICEAQATGMPVTLFDMPVKNAATSTVRFVEAAVKDGRVRRLGQSLQHAGDPSGDGIASAMIGLGQNYLEWLNVSGLGHAAS